jgi:hypothetical protein
MNEALSPGVTLNKMSSSVISYLVLYPWKKNKERNVIYLFLTFLCSSLDSRKKHARVLSINSPLFQKHMQLHLLKLRLWLSCNIDMNQYILAENNFTVNEISPIYEATT